MSDTADGGSEHVANGPGVAVVGAGRWGANHVRTWADMGLLRVVVDTDEGRRQVVNDMFPDVRTVSALADALAMDDVEAVVVAAPAVAHVDLAIAALEAGRHVLIEKPLAIDVQGGERVVEAANRTHRVAMVGHVLEYHPAVVALRDAVASGALGKLRYLYSNRLNFGAIRTEENALWSFAPHDIALFLRFAGTTVQDIRCSGGSYVSPGVADVTLMSLDFADGVRGHIFVSWLHPFKEQRLVIVGERQMAVFNDTAPWDEKLMLYPHEVEWRDGRVPFARAAIGQPVPVTPIEPLRAECEHFVDAIRRRATPLTSVEAGLDVLRVLDAGQRSLESGGQPVRLRDHRADAPPAGGPIVHPTATLDNGADVGSNTRIWHYSHVMPGCVIGDDCNLGQNTFVADGAVIGNRVKIQNNVSVYTGVTLEDDVFCGPSVVFTNVTNPRSEVNRTNEYRSTIVRSGATIGANATIVCGVTIGSYAFVAAGAVVTSDVPDYGLVMGAPARLSGWRCRCGEALPHVATEATCSACGRCYRWLSEGRIAEFDATATP